MKPLKDRILVFPEVLENQTESGIFLGKSQVNYRKGEVLATGNDVSKDITIGSKIAWNRFKGIQIDYDKKQCLLIVEDEDDVFLID